MKQTILIADDVELNLEMLADIFEEEYDVLLAHDGFEARDILRDYSTVLSAVLLDINMPGISGLEILDIMNKSGLINTLPVLMITTDTATKIEKACLELGAYDFIKKPFSPVIVKTRVKNMVNLYSYKNNLEEKVNLQTAKLRHTNHSLVNVLGNLVESRNLESGEHVQRVSGYTRLLAMKMMELHPEYELTKKKVDIIADSAALHDLGKIAIPDAILLKPGRLTPEEFEIMKTHTTKGYEYISKMDNLWDEEYLKSGMDIAKYHHERYDGRGYPEGLKEDEIPISAQLVSIADVYDALIHERCYKKAFPKETAKEMILNGDCGVFSPKLLECFEKCYPFLEIDKDGD